MSPASGDRAAHFPAIERKYGEPMSYWFKVMEQISDRKYPEQAAFLAENYGFSRAHANALIMYSRGSTSSKRFATVNDFYKTVTPAQRKTMKALYEIVTSAVEGSEVVIAWNKPMVRVGKDYIFGVAPTAKYLLMSPWSDDVLADFTPRLEKAGLTVNKKTIQIPSDWTINKKLVLDMVKARIAEIS